MGALTSAFAESCSATFVLHAKSQSRATECDTNLESPVALRFPLQESLHHGTDRLCRYRLVCSRSRCHLGAQLEKAYENKPSRFKMVSIWDGNDSSSCVSATGEPIIPG